jgi:anion-transporting  ArsA/GET3 family ATPase
MPAIDEILDGKDICICAGSGGVGKTTTSAAIAAGMAARGLRVCVLTIDPAKRLADSLGLRELGNEAKRVDPALFEQHGIEMKGELWAMMLDAKATFDELVARQAPDEESRDRVLNNRIYQQISNALAGSQEYMAMEKLFELHTEGRFDLLVLDTPPTRNALDFLDAPRRLTQFIEGRSLRVFMKPTGLAARVAGRGATVALGVLKRIVGFDLLADLAEFFNAFSGMVDGFQARAKRVNSLLADPHTCFLVVCGPQGEPIDEAVYFHRKLVEAKLPFGGVIVNKVHYPAERLRSSEGTGAGDGDGDGLGTAGGRHTGASGVGGEVEAALVARLGEGDLARRVAENFADYQALADRDASNIEHLAAELRTSAVIRVPYLDEDVHDLGGLAEINRYLFASAEQREAIAAGRA